jgi:FG-GAP repeat protein
MRRSRTRRWTLPGTRVPVAVVLAAVAALLPLRAAPTQAASSNVFDFPCSGPGGTSGSSEGSVTGDFNADGRPDLAVGAPGDNLEQTEVDGSITRGWDDAGSINIIYSDASGLAPENTVTGNPDATPPIPSRTRKYFSQNTPGVNEGSETNDNFGFAIAAGNFDGQLGDDLAVGVPGENNGRGAVQVLYSGPNETTPTSLTDSDGLVVGIPGTPTFNQFITQSTAGVDGSSEDGDHFGYAMVAAYFNNDFFEDLVIGVPGEDVGTIKDAGIVQVIYGTPHGLDPNGPTAGGQLADQVFEQGPGAISKPEVGRAEAGDFFGASVVTGQFNDGGAWDLAVGSPGEDVGTIPDGGGVRVLYSLNTDVAAGLSTVESDFFTQQTKDVNGIAETADRMGCSLASGDFDGDTDDDLAIGVPGEGVGKNASAGVVQTLYNTGTITGISVTPSVVHANPWIEDQVWIEDEGGIPGVSKENDRMGASLATGDFDGDTTDDLAIGLPTELLYTNNRSGSVRIMYGFKGYGLTDGPGSGKPPTAKLPVAFAQSPSDLPSTCLLMGILDDLTVLDPLLDPLGGPCTVFNFFSGNNDYSPLLMVEEEGDLLGASLAVDDFDKNGLADLVIGSPGEDLGLFVNWLVEEEAEIPDELLSPLLPIDEAKDAGVLNVVYGPFPAGPATPPPGVPEKQDLIYREGNSPFGALRSLLHSLVPSLLQDNQIHVTPADPSSSKVLEGDSFGADQS